jgi:hypothetical protein
MSWAAGLHRAAFAECRHDVGCPMFRRLSGQTGGVPCQDIGCAAVRDTQSIVGLAASTGAAARFFLSNHADRVKFEGTGVQKCRFESTTKIGAEHE